MPREHHWLHPQTVPRGFLRFYILTLLSKSPQTGYSIIQGIDERTEGAWKPGAGTMYPLLKSLQREGLIGAKGKGRFRKTYVLTQKGSQALAEVRGVIAGMGRKEAIMGRLFSDLLPGEVFVSMMTKRYRESTEFFRQKMSDIPPLQRAGLLRDLRLVVASQLDWIDAELASAGSGSEAEGQP